MTTLIYKYPFFAADSRLTNSDEQPLLYTKIKTMLLNRQLYYYAIAGHTISGQKLINYLISEQNGLDCSDYDDIEADDNFTIVILGHKPNNTTKLITLCNELLPIEIQGKYFAFGSGAEYALGALAAGADIEKALKIAINYDAASSAPLQIVDITA